MSIAFFVKFPKLFPLVWWGDCLIFTKHFCQKIYENRITLTRVRAENVGIAFCDSVFSSGSFILDHSSYKFIFMTNLFPRCRNDEILFDIVA